jgi:hypothetical protein
MDIPPSYKMKEASFFGADLWNLIEDDGVIQRQRDRISASSVLLKTMIQPLQRIIPENEGALRVSSL